MAINKYLNDRGLETLVKEIKKSTAKVYKVKGSAIYADDDYLAREDKHSEIDSHGLWKLVDGTWTKVTVFEVGWVYNIENRFTTDRDFVEEETTLDAGTNIVVAEVEGEPPIYKWDVLGNALDLTDYQTKKLAVPLTMFSNETAVVYASSDLLPESENKVTAAITDNMIAILSGDKEAGDVYRASVAEDAEDATKNKITWKKLGNQNTVAGALELLSNVTPNTPISDQEIINMFNA